MYGLWCSNVLMERRLCTEGKEGPEARVVEDDRTNAWGRSAYRLYVLQPATLPLPADMPGSCIVAVLLATRYP